MSGAALRVAMLPRGVDGLFLPPVEGVEVLALVPRDSPEETWARALYPPERVLAYAWRRADLGPYPATSDILEHSDVPALLQESGTEALFLSASCTPRTLAWAQHHGVRLLMCGHTNQCLCTPKHTCGQAVSSTQVLQSFACISIRHHRKGWTKPCALRGHTIYIGRRRECKGLKTLAMPCNDV